MILSIVTGTFQRLQYLRRMIHSARGAIPVGFDYQIIIVDGGSTDGTIDWCKEQPDIHLIEHGALLGAIRAFTDGAAEAEGTYTILANDDIEFIGDGIMRAVVHLETTPICGAVCFADDRPAPSYGTGYKVQFMTARRGTQFVNVPYAQVGMFRTWLGNEAGWWGADDPIMSQSRTYGGDNYLSARILELGYTIGIVDGVQINDLLAPDALREANIKDAESKPSPYYERYPHGPLLAEEPQITIDYREQVRVLYLPVYEPGMGHYKQGLRDALARRFLVYELDYVNEPFDLPELVSAFKPHLLLTQLHAANTVTPTMLAQARAAMPEMVVVNWNGDCEKQHLIGTDMLNLLAHVDLQLVVNASALPTYAQHGINAAYWQIGFEPVIDPLPTVKAHDIVFLANAYSEARHALGRALKATPYDVGLYGYGWPDASGNTLYYFAAGAALYRSAKIAIGDNQYPDDYGFVSNRVFEALANGAFLMHQHVNGLEELTGLRDGVHYIAWTDERDLKEKLAYWLDKTNNAQRLSIVRAGETFVREHHSFEARVRELFTALLAKARQAV